jgi:hypothetical protein
MPRDPFVRENFTRERNAARKCAAEYFQWFPKKRYQTEVESWRHLQSQNIEFTMKRLREVIEPEGYMFSPLPDICMVRSTQIGFCNVKGRD